MAKRSTLAIALLLLSFGMSAKKVKFSVDMTGQTISAAGVHIVGDFRSEAGLGADFARVAFLQGNADFYWYPQPSLRSPVAIFRPPTAVWCRWV